MPANAAVYIPTAKVDLSKIFSEVTSDKRLFKKASYFDVRLDKLDVRFNVMKSEELDEHLNGFCGYIASLEHEEERKSDATNVIMQTKTVLGLSVQEEFDDSPELWQSLFQIADKYNGSVFVYDSVLTPSGGAIVGPMVESDS
jgi:hypothetical protein